MGRIVVTSFCAALLLQLAACTSTRVHLYSEGLEPAELEKITWALKGAGYSFVVNTRPVPVQVRRPSLVYAPEHRDHRQLLDLGDLLFNLGYALDLVPTSIGNNFYTANNVGLYPLAYERIRHDQNPDRKSGNKLSGKEFNGSCPRIDAWLYLDTDNSFSMGLLDWDDAAARSVEKIIKGTWEQRGTQLLLQSKGTRHEFTVEEFRDSRLMRLAGTERVVKFSALKLLHMDDGFEDCDFVFREPVKL